MGSSEYDVKYISHSDFKSTIQYRPATCGISAKLPGYQGELDIGKMGSACFTIDIAKSARKLVTGELGGKGTARVFCPGGLRGRRLNGGRFGGLSISER